MSGISLLTPSLPGRERMLCELLECVAAQTLAPAEHLIGRDSRGLASMLNRLAGAADGEWLAIVEDDDLIDAGHLETLAAAADVGAADVVYSFCRTAGAGVEIVNCDDAASRDGNIPVTALYRRDLVRELGGWRPVREPDWDFYRRALAAGACFRCVPEVTWTYRFHGGNDTLLRYRQAAGVF